MYMMYGTRPVYKEERVEEEVIEDQSSELTLNQLEEEIQAWGY